MATFLPSAGRRILAVALAGVFCGAVASASAQAPADDHSHHHHAIPPPPPPAPMAGHDHAAMGHDHAAMGHAPPPAAAAAPPQAGHDGHEGHEQHEAMLKQQGYVRSEAVYDIPDRYLVDQNGRRVAARDVLGGPRPVMLNFIYTTCTTICPVLSASFTQTQRALGPDARDVQLVSITIDPEHDTPERLREYAQRFKAGEGWQLYTGSLEDVVAVQKAFDAFRGSKASHIPLTLVRAAPEGPWVRMAGFASANELVQEYRTLASPTGLGPRTAR